MQELRDAIASAWITVKDFALWQTLFQYFCANHVKEDPPQTPPKKRNKNTKPSPAKSPEVATPPRPEPHQVHRVEGAEAVPISKKRLPASPNLMPPQKKHARALMEPEVPDVEGAFYQAMQEEADPNSSRVEDVSAEMISNEAGKAVAPKRVPHERRFKSRVKSSREINLKIVDNFLAARGLTYLAHCQLHRQQALMKKASVCTDQGWKQFKERLLGEKMPECQACLHIMKKFSFTLDDIAFALEAGGTEMSQTVGPKKSEETESSVPDGAQPTAAGDQQPEENPSAEDEVERCKAYVTSFGPVIELLEENGKFGYRCRACKTKKQPLGKVNKLPKMVLNSVKNYLHQHLECPSHVDRMKMLEAADSKLDSQPVDCKGLCISTYTESNLHHYLAEFNIWISYSPMTSHLTQHSYSCQLNSREWWVKHCNCLGQYIPQDEKAGCCKRCLSLGDPQSLQKRVVRFVTKYYAAMASSKGCSAKMKMPQPSWKKSMLPFSVATMRSLGNRWLTSPMRGSKLLSAEFGGLCQRPQRTSWWIVFSAPWLNPAWTCMWDLWPRTLSAFLLNLLMRSPPSRTANLVRYWTTLLTFLGCLEDSWDCLGMFGNVWDIFGI